MAMTKPKKNDEPERESEARQLRRELFDEDMLDKLMAATDERGLSLTGEGGFLPEMIKAVLERGMQAELTEHLGYEQGERAGHGSGNSRNGTTPKTMGTEVGDIGLEQPREPQLHVRLGAGAQGRSAPGWAGGHDHLLTVADEYFAVSEKVEALYTPAPLPAEAEGPNMRQLRVEANRRLLGNGYCTRPAELGCRYETICETCTFFAPTIAFRGTLQDQHDDAQTHGETHRQNVYANILKRLDEPGT